MSKPNVSVVVEPADGSSICFEPVAAKDTHSKGAGVLCLELTITNNEKKSVHLTKVTLTFHAPPAVPTATIPGAEQLVAAGRLRRTHRARSDGGLELPP